MVKLPDYLSDTISLHFWLGIEIDNWLLLDAVLIRAANLSPGFMRIIIVMLSMAVYTAILQTD